jgi:quercetin dioxygenase-like cupin family protein
MKIIKTAELPEIGVSHNPEIKKKVFIDSQQIPKLMMFGEATFKSGQAVEKHSHATMFEVFYIQSGRAIFNINGEAYEVTAGDCITVEPGVEHFQSNPFDTDTRWIYFGIATD